MQLDDSFRIKLHNRSQQGLLKCKGVLHQATAPMLDNQPNIDALATCAASCNLNLAFNPLGWYAVFMQRVTHHFLHQLTTDFALRTTLDY